MFTGTLQILNPFISPRTNLTLQALLGALRHTLNCHKTDIFSPESKIIKALTSTTENSELLQRVIVRLLADRF